MDKPGVKHIELPCLNSISFEPCQVTAFVQVVVVEETDKQEKIDALALKKLDTSLKKDHREGKHVS